jgi:hypothetical protein
MYCFQLVIASDDSDDEIVIVTLGKRKALRDAETLICILLEPREEGWMKRVLQLLKTW